DQRVGGEARCRTRSGPLCASAADGGRAQRTGRNPGQADHRSVMEGSEGRGVQIGCAVPQRDQRATTFRLTGVSPSKSRWRAPAGVKSMTRPGTNGPRSLMRTIIDLLFLLLVTSTLVPNGRLRCAAVRASGCEISPLAVSSRSYE